ncbi:MAG: sodium:alanine symporter family protein [Clostridia bacterium]|nr:sodium:alanine symporter family protein [Clostridia bacterium]
MELINTYLSGFIMPFLLMGCGIYLGAKLRFFYILHPLKTLRTIGESGRGGGVSPFRALSQALAGTLGVGNMTGVATAICCGGAGAVFWMWMSALLAMSVKYFEVYLAVKCRRRGADGYFGGAMYYIKDIFSKSFPKAAPVLGGCFAVLCITNSVLTGNIIQVNSAAGAFPKIHPLFIGASVAAFVLPAALGKGKRISGVTFALIPILTVFYTGASLFVIAPNISRIPEVMGEIIKGAFSLKSAGGGVGGYMIMRAIRFGTTRGIFSNEAGSGTSPTAHAEADTKSPHHQGCLGIFEVFCDTILLCTMTAFVILLSDGTKKGLSGIGLTLYAFSSQAGRVVGLLVGVSVILFAYATVICQISYGAVALRSLTKRRGAFYAYILLSVGATIVGSVMGEGIMWQAADLVISLMTALNTLCLLWWAINSKGSVMATKE